MNPLFNLFEKGFTVFGLIFFTGVLSFDSLYISPDPKADTAAISNPIYPLLSIIQIAVYGITTLLLIARWRGSIQTALRNKLVWGLVGLVLISFFWSDFPDVSSRKGFNAVQTALFGLYMASRFSLKEQLRLLALSLGIVAIISLLFSFAFRGAAIETGANAGAWRGPFTQKNLIARLMTLSVPVCLLAAMQKDKRPYFFWLSGFISFILLFLSGSKTALLIFISLMILLPLYRALRWRTTITIPLVIMLIVIGGSIGAAIVGNWESLLLSLGRDPSLSGRTVLWEVALEKIAERPLLGYGFQGFWQPEGEANAVWKVVQYKPPHAHNGYINTALDLGLIGLIFFIVSIGNVYIRAIGWLRIDKTTAGLLPIIYVTFFFMYNHTENTIIEHNSIYWVMFIAMALSMKQVRVSHPSDEYVRKNISSLDGQL